jgi:ribosomal protein S18 acetylase RimI-like enzyme
MQRLENEARVRGLQSIALETYTFQAPEFYTKLGFNEVGRYINHPSRGIDKVFYQKNLCGV